MTNAMIPYEKGPEHTQRGAGNFAGKARVAGLEQVEINGDENVLYTSQSSGEQMILSVMWSVLLSLSVLLLVFGLFTLETTVRMVLCGGFAVCAALILGRLYRYYKWDKKMYIVLTDRTLYTNTLYQGRQRQPDAVIPLERITGTASRLHLGAGRCLLLRVALSKGAQGEWEMRFQRGEDFHIFSEMLHMVWKPPVV